MYPEIQTLGTPMSRNDWYRQTTWSAANQAAFFAKLRRARNKAQYLRIQALYLQEEHPEEALKLLDAYFEVADEDIDLALAWAQRADCGIALGREQQVLQSFRECFRREQAFAGQRTNGYLSFGLWVARNRRTELYDEVLAVFAARERWPLFPDTRYRFNAVLALMADDCGNAKAASAYARLALEAASATDSGLPRHPDLGLVRHRHDDVEARLRDLAAA